MPKSANWRFFLIPDSVERVDDTGGNIAGVAADSFQIAAVKCHGGSVWSAEVSFTGNNLIDDLLAVGRMFLFVLAHHGAGQFLVAFPESTVGIEENLRYAGFNLG